MQLQDKTLYILTGANLISLNAEDGTILSNGVLPKELTPPTPNLPKNMLRGAGRQGSRQGGRGGAQ
jgi:hypothetical protein